MTQSLRAVARSMALLLGCALVLGGSQGADKTPAKGSGPLLTPAQLRDCLAQKDKLHAQTDDALKDKAAIEADKADIARSGASLGGEVATLDRTSASAVDSYNGKVGERDRLIEGYQAKVSAYNVKAEAVKATKESYQKTCELKRYDERDLTDTKRKKQ